MENGTSSLVWEIRSASRDLVREFGFMNRTVAGTDLSVSAGLSVALARKSLGEHHVYQFLVSDRNQ